MKRFINLAKLVMAAAVGLLGSGAPGWGQEALREDRLPASSVEESLVPMELAFRPLIKHFHRPFDIREKLKEQLKDLPPFIRDAKLEVNPRTFYFYRDNFGQSKNEAWTLGGSLAFKSGYFLDHLAVGAVGYTSDRLYAPPGRDGTGLLKPGQKNINALGQIYGEIKFTDKFIIELFRKDHDTPYINPADVRMIPNTFEAYTFWAKIGGDGGAPQFRFGAGYFTKMKTVDSSQFIPMSQVAGARVDRGVWEAGGIFEANNISLGAINYYSQDIINIFYIEGKVTLPLKGDWGFQLATQFSDQESTGSNLLYGHPFSTRQFGVRGNLSYRKAMLTLAYTSNAIGGNLLRSWGSYPGYTGVQFESFNKAGEQAFMIQGTYNFARLGLPGVTAYALFVHGWNEVNPNTKQAVPKSNEFNLDLQWKPESGLLEGFWFRLRYFHNWEQVKGNPTINNLRLIVNYRFSVL